ncbi:MAG TPA: hypothetical protein VFH88_03200 [Candidatus Krumholzibacteria bacterium]|nr:hypothetical protein [Candidatus Krumholzibacteria bacterium]
MKKVLLLMVAALMVSSVAMADHFGVYTDATGSSCLLASGFTTTATVIEKFSAGTTGSRFKVTFPAGTAFYAFTTPYVPIGNLTSDLSLAYGTCLTGDVPLGTITAMLAAGNGSVDPAELFATIIYTDCSFGEYAATGGAFHVDGTGSCLEPSAVQNSTWGQVKALYR